MIDINENFDTMFQEDPTVSLQYNMERFTSNFKIDGAAMATEIADLQERMNNTTDENMKKWYKQKIEGMEQAAKDGTS